MFILEGNTLSSYITSIQQVMEAEAEIHSGAVD